MKALVFTPSALFRLSQCAITDEWFETFSLPTGIADIRRINLNDKLYFVENTLDRDDVSLVVIDIGGLNPVFSQGDRNINILDRIITIARSTFTRSANIPYTWRSFHDGSLLSVYITNRTKGGGARVNCDLNPNGQNCLFVFATTVDELDLQRIPRDLDLYKGAVEDLAAAILTAPQALESDSRAGIVLTSRLPQGFSQGATLEEWYRSKLTTEQREFVDKPHDGPVRLRGAAGTGKTISLVIKAIRDAKESEKSKVTAKFGFITHSLASVDLTSAICESLDQTGLLSGGGQYCSIELRTLYDLAHQFLKFDLVDLKPLSLDGREGRKLQSEIILAALQAMIGSPIVRYEFEGMSEGLLRRSESASVGDDPKFIAEVMNEFASILDADGIRSGTDKAERYAKGQFHRSAVSLELPMEQDRRFVLEIHRRYREFLAEMNTLSVDQMIADFNSLLDSNRWDALRHRYGYDALFVDELHLFTSTERQILHKLIKPSKDEAGRPKRPAIFMAYDLKQSPNDTFLSNETGSSIFSTSSGLQNSSLVRLDKVFRYTPEIAEFLSDLDAAFPAVDIPGEWGAYSGIPQLGTGIKPQLYVYPDEQALFKSVFSQAQRLGRTIEGGGRRVAVLCASAEMFDSYLPVATGQFEGSIFPISDREPTSELRHAGKRFIFSMPEYVAGLQFHTVFLINVDSIEAPLGSSVGLRRRFISSVYLGSSRAEQNLFISSCTTRGGPSDILDMSLQRGSLERAQMSAAARS